MLAEYGPAEPEGRARARDRDGRRLPDRGPARERASSGRRSVLSGWPYSKAVFLPHAGRGARGARAPARCSVQTDLAATLRKLVEAEQQALAAGKSRQGGPAGGLRPLLPRATSPRSWCAATQEQGGLITKDDLARWQVKLEEPVRTTYKGIDVYKLTVWTQGPAMLQALNILENADLKAMGYNSPRYIHTVYQAMSHGLRRPRLLLRRPGVPAGGAGGGAPLEGVREAALRRDAPRTATTPTCGPGDPYPFQGGENPFKALLDAWHTVPGTRTGAAGARPHGRRDDLRRGLPRRAPPRSSPPTPRAGWSR